MWKKTKSNFSIVGVTFRPEHAEIKQNVIQVGQIANENWSSCEQKIHFPCKKELERTVVFEYTSGVKIKDGTVFQAAIPTINKFLDYGEKDVKGEQYFLENSDLQNYIFGCKNKIQILKDSNFPVKAAPFEKVVAKCTIKKYSVKVPYRIALTIKGQPYSSEGYCYYEEFTEISCDYSGIKYENE